MDLNISLNEIADNHNYSECHMNRDNLSTWSEYKEDNFTQRIIMFSGNKLINVTPLECDHLFNTLMSDKIFYQRHQKLWHIYARYICETIKYLINGLPHNSEYRNVYTKFMNEREHFRNRNDDNDRYIQKYNDYVWKWRFPK